MKFAALASLFVLGAFAQDAAPAETPAAAPAVAAEPAAAPAEAPAAGAPADEVPSELPIEEEYELTPEEEEQMEMEELEAMDMGLPLEPVMVKDTVWIPSMTYEPLVDEKGTPLTVEEFDAMMHEGHGQQPHAL
uniref:Uncharacterized protein n=1 Tax=Chromera velia CCMP2878 TaxID=1169474 RepID=A0A0G4IFU0_9ALVE|eukprot:Cvel_14013.t1-p1 / transcript=Cvel_14013.t1 / gene=Cvel_14013 / organism=Chromera_velia_CCMP2878 / gene_product=hypothetical protein / transcript_product=hypothetical protein / location=Cvel_scaffold981:63-763(-) / protein_length=133 / sequence_SO=supercontig / SO=protein_coding / is_pseudo=false